MSAEHPVDERLAVTLCGYEIRARLRPTPNAVFAGVARAVFSRAAASLRLGSGHRARSNPSPAWLTAVCGQLLEDPDVLSLLTLTADNLIIRRGRRLEHEQQAAPGGTGPHRVTVRATDATVLILRTCRAGTTIDQVITEVVRRWPTVPESVVRATVLSLVRSGFLLSDLLPADLGDDPLRHLLSRLPAANPGREKLASLRRLLADADRYRLGDSSRLAALTAARDLADEISFQERALTVDVVADARLVLPTALADQAARAAGVLWRIGWGQGPLIGYHDRFLHRYGPHRFVPLSEATDPAIGLGLDTDVFDIDAVPWPPDRTAALAALLAQGTAHGGTEVVLDAGTIAALAGDQTAEPPPRTAEIHVRVLAATQQDLAAGRLHLAVCPGGGSQEAGSSQGRFTGLIPGTPSDLEEPPMLVAELVVRPRAPEAAALAPRTGFAPWRIPVGVPARKGDLVLDDLLLISNGDGLIVWSASRDRQVVPVLYSRLAPRLLPPLARFLQLLGQTGCRPWRSWSWGPLADLPFQPRVRYERTVLSPARWVLPPELTGAVHDRTAWNGALHAWRTAAIPPPPDIVVTEVADRRLPLDLRRSDDRELLRRYVRRGVLAVAEQPGGPGAVQAVVPGPTGNHLLEVVVPLARRTTVTGPARPATVPVRTAGTGLYLPGGPWLSLAVRSPSHCHDQILSELATVAEGLTGHFDTWFWLRYADTTHGPHIRARFHGHPVALGGHLLPALSAWCSEMIRQRLSGGFVVEPYEQEIERYGGPDAIHAAEQVFAADSHLVLKALDATTDRDQRLVIAALSAVTIARTVADGDPAALRGHHLDRAARQCVATLRPQMRSTRSQDDTSSPIPALTDLAWTARQDALISYRNTLKPAHRPSCASTLIHMRQPAPRQCGHRAHGPSAGHRPARTTTFSAMSTRIAVSAQQALATAERLLDPENVLTAAPASAGASLASGLAGTALIHARLSTTDPVFATAAIRHWETGAVHARRYGDNSAGTFHSLGGLAASLIIGSQYLPDPDSQRTVTTRAARWLSARALDLTRRHEEHLRAGGVGTTWSLYDAINGLAGIGRVLLAALTSGHDATEPGLLAALETLTTMIGTRHGNRPGWWLPASDHPPAVTVHPSGAATTGMAHGIAGPLALLATAHTAGWSVAGQRTAIQEAAQWLLRWRSNATPCWPPYVTGDDLDSDTVQPAAGRRDAWCYGAPGIGRALTLAGHALADPRLTEAGDTAIASLAERPAELWDVAGPTLCHGHAGVLQSAANSRGTTADRAAAAVTEAFDPRLAFAFQHLENGSAADEPGLLTGSAGVALALADHGQLPAPPVPARWDSILLLS